MQGSTNPTREIPRHITSDFSITTVSDTKTIYFKLSVGVVVVEDVYPTQLALGYISAAEGGKVKEISNRVIYNTSAYMRSTRDREDRVYS